MIRNRKRIKIMSKLPKISIITPSYNQADFLEATILSIHEQDYPNLEHIVMDGGSTDGSVDIIKKYEDKLTYWVSEKDAGQTDAINRGFAMCTGEIFNWINSDDRLKPGTLHSVAKQIQKNPKAGAWVGGCDRIGPKGEYINTVMSKSLKKDEMADWGVVGHFFQPACFFRKDAWDKYGPLDTRYSFAFDFDFFLKTVVEYEFVVVDEIWTEATIHEDAKTQAQIPQMKTEIYVIQIRHGYERLAMERIALAEEIAMETGKEDPAALIVERDKYKAQNEALLDSLSWRVTSPLRAAGKYMGKK